MGTGDLGAVWAQVYRPGTKHVAGGQENQVLLLLPWIPRPSAGVGKFCLSRTLRIMYEEANSLKITLQTFFSAMKCLYLFWSFLREALYSLSSN